MSTNSKAYNKRVYSKYWGNKKAIKQRAARNKARKLAGLKKGDPREAHHKDGNPENNKSSNIAKVTRKYNRRDGANKANRNKKKK